MPIMQFYRAIKRLLLEIYGQSEAALTTRLWVENYLADRQIPRQEE